MGRPVRGTSLGTVCIVVLLVVAGCTSGIDVGEGPSVPDDLGQQNDPDGDGLNNSVEAEIGTDPNDSDTDGDRLKDGWEYHNETSDGAALPDADPLHKDLYVQVSYAQRIPALTDAERRNLTAIWAGMNVTNPDGEPGIDIHIDDDPPHGGRVNESRTFTEIPYEFHHEQYDRYVPDERKCVYHGTTFVDIDPEGTDAGGYGRSPGYRSIVSGRLEGRTASGTVSSYNLRVRGLTHELLHNIVGNVTSGPDPNHTGDEGWLAETYVSPDNESEWTEVHERLSGPTSRKLSTEGFSGSSTCESLTGPFRIVPSVAG